MASEIKLNASLRIDNGNYHHVWQPGQYSITQSSTGGGSPGTVTIGTSEEDVSFGDIVPGIVTMQNLDATNYVEYGPKSGGSMVAFGRLQPGGEPAVVRFTSGVTMTMKANTGACKVLIQGHNA